MPWMIEAIAEEGLAPPFPLRWLKGVARQALEALSFPPGRLSLLIAGEARIRELNRRYLGREGSTDVLSFPLGGEDFPTSPRHLPYLGEVVLCLPQAQRQADHYGHSLRQEMALLLIHGLLHLVGYEDATLEKRNQMRQQESRLLSQVGFPNRKEKDGAI